MNWEEMTGPERIRAGIELDRGGRAPQVPVRFICGAGDAPTVEAHDLPRAPRRTLRDRLAGAVANALICPGCLCLRFGPGHLSRKLLFGIDCERC